MSFLIAALVFIGSVWVLWPVLMFLLWGMLHALQNNLFSLDSDDSDSFGK